MTRRAEADYALRATDESRAGFQSFGRRMDALGKRAERFGDVVGRKLERAFSNPLAIAAGGFAAVAGGAALATRAIIQTSGELDGLSKKARDLGVEFEVLTALRPVADHAGASFEGLVKAIERIGPGLARAAEGGKTMSRVFDTLGLNVEKMQEASRTTQFAAIVEQVNALNRPATRDSMIRALNDLFGRRGAQDVLRIAEGGLENLRAGVARAGEFGFIRSEEEGLAAERLADATADLHHAWAGLTESLTANAEIVTWLAERFEALTGVILPITRAIREGGISRGVLAAGAAASEGMGPVGHGIVSVIPWLRPLSGILAVLERIENNIARPEPARFE